MDDNTPQHYVTSLRNDRDTDDLALDKRLESSSDEPDAAGAALLKRLGLGT